MKKLYPLLSVLFLIINSNINSEEIPLISKNELKVCSGNYNDGSKEFTGTYLDGIKDGTLVSKKCWDKNGKSIGCDLLEMSDSERYRTFKEK